MQDEKSEANSKVIEIQPASLAGMAEFLREQYRLADDKAIRCRNPETGETDVSHPITAETRLVRRMARAKEQYHQRRIARSKRAEKERIRQRRKYGQSVNRDPLNPPEIDIIGQGLTPEKIEGSTQEAASDTSPRLGPLFDSGENQQNAGRK